MIYIGECGCRHDADDNGAIYVGECCESDAGEMGVESDVSGQPGVGTVRVSSAQYAHARAER